MPPSDDAQLTTEQRRRALRLAYVNAAVWALGNGMASTTLVIYLALELGAEGLAISLILATPQLVGLLRLAAPAIIRRVGDRKRFAVTAYFISALILVMLPKLSAPGVAPSREWSMALVVSLWSAYHLLEYLATIALWSYLGDLAPRRIRGTFIGIRERWLTLGRIGGMLASGLFAFAWRTWLPQQPVWIAYAIPAGWGAAMMVAAVLPLLRMPSLPLRRQEPLKTSASPPKWLAPFADRRFQRLLFFGCWFSFFNGVTQTAQNIYPAKVLGMHLFAMLALRTVMRSGQSLASPTLGRLADRWGNRPVMIVSQLLVATGPLFFLFATPTQRWWLFGAFLVWIAYAGLNVCLPNLMLKLAPGGDSPSYIATFYAVTGLCYGLSTIGGGFLFEYLKTSQVSIIIGPISLDYYGVLFVTGWITRSLGVVLLLLLIEPGARTWRQILTGQR